MLDMKILLIEDSPDLVRQIQTAFDHVGWVVEHASDGVDGLYLATTQPCDAIVLDLGLPRLDGLSLLRKLREQEVRVPVIILSARETIHDRIEGLNSGADDYLCKPFLVVELIARIRALVRRSSGNPSPILTYGALSVDTRSSHVYWNDEPVKLTALEFKVLSHFLYNKGKVISRSELIEHIYHQDFDRDSNTVEVFIRRIRKKLSNEVIETVRGLGYRLG